jgi:SCY1-like protein 1
MGLVQHRRTLLSSDTLIVVADFAQRTVKFINEEASSIHGSLKVGSVYTSESGEWKLGGFEVLSNVKDDDAVIYVRIATPSQRYSANKDADLR